MTKPKIVIAIPSGRPLTESKFPKRVIRFAQELGRLLPAFQVLISHSSCERESHSINTLIEEFRADPSAVWLFLWNTRVLVTPEQLVKMIAANKGVVAAIHTNCENPAQWEAAFYPDVLPDEKELLPVAEISGSAKLFHRDVFDTIEKAVPELSYVFDQSGRSMAAFCQERLQQFDEYRRLLTPASFLDMLCRKANIGIYAHAGVVVKQRGWDGQLYPLKEPYRPWLFKRAPPPVCAEDLPEVAHDPRPVAVVIQFCDKDSVQSRTLSAKITSMGHTHVFLEYSPGDKYPAGPNKLACTLLRAGAEPQFKAVLLVEPDCVPLTPDWLDQLSRDWDRCAAAGKLIMGSWHPVNIDHPRLGHINGNLMFSPDLAQRVQIPDVPDDKPWDTFLADVFAPVWARTGLIKNLNRHRTASVKQLSTPECGTKPPVLIHGVRDNSAWDYAKTK